MTRSCTEGAPPCSPPPRVPANPSTSSMNITEGADVLARENTARTAFSESPTHFENSSDPLMEMKLRPDALATARASIVLLHPGGPYSRIPLGGEAPTRFIASGCFSAHSTASFKRSFTSSRPPTSSQATFGTSMATSRNALGRTFTRACSKSSIITRSSRDDMSMSPIARATPSTSSLTPDDRLDVFSITRVSARIAAFWHSDAMSAPTNPCARRARSTMYSSVKS
mmetsp:Transcript_6254/g.24921  ORF Transcript_6254/g.24921 Transcript_6254/m.24921 type:complete len:227 (+) Transcript_6254:2117-2797(+)